jgi:hypothetical protein
VKKINIVSLSLGKKKTILVRYSSEVEQRMQLHFGQLREKNRRHYAAIEADKLGYGGLRYISEVLGLNEQSIRNGIQELKNPDLVTMIPKGKQRRRGGGRKKRID